MYLTISTTHEPATDLGYLLHKKPGKLHSIPLSFGTAHVFYPIATEERCTAALLIEVDPVGLVRKPGGPRGGEGGLLEQYVNDRPYASPSFTSVALARAFGTALGGRSKSREELAQTELPLEIHAAVLPCRGGEGFLRRLFEPLGYTVNASRHPLDEKFPDWGDSRYWSVTLTAKKKLQDVLRHLYVLLPVLDDEKHYWVGKDEVEKLLRRGEGWLVGHPEREEITRRYLKYQHRLMREALARLTEEEEDPDEVAEEHTREESVLEERISLNQQRLGSVLAVLRQSGAKRVLDLGCGEGGLLSMLLGDASFGEIVGVDVSPRVLEKAAQRLRLETLPTRKRERIQLLQGSLMYRDARLSGYDAAAVVEVVEHLDPPRLAAFERVLFEHARPKTIVLTTPNREYNVKFETMPADTLRHKDHRFEWTRGEFQSWASRVASQYAYGVSFLPVGEEDSVLGAPTQMVVFRLAN
jgi:3' terminal RNA ribose 2'-O-methyltransferase Hen1